MYISNYYMNMAEFNNFDYEIMYIIAFKKNHKAQTRELN